MSEFSGVADTMLIPMAARIYASKRFPEYFYDETALSLEEKIPGETLERIWKSSSEYTMLASVARYHNFDEITKNFIAAHEKCNIINLGAGLETAAFRLQAESVQTTGMQANIIQADNLQAANVQTSGNHTVDIRTAGIYTGGAIFYEIDLPEVIELRKNILGKKGNETLIGADLFTLKWAENIDASLPSLLVVSGVFQYFHEEKILSFLSDVKKRFPAGELIFDATNEIGIKYANKYVKKTGNASAHMYFYVNDCLAFAKKCDMELVERRTFYTAARKMLKRKLKLYTRIAMKACDDGGRTVILHLKLN
ncbi:class I SAM-dependent methyltransferase [Treponema parvum]|uniref:class I SAM-dependent methyltransferase n=1 Tax=Treponema parvum TaxID=138851 RepID=UPI00211EDBD0|nr:class I SAM-dependent methyltransferase [Treponema parvum]